MQQRLAVIVPTPAHSALAGPLSYRSELALAPGTLVRVPLGRREVLGVVWETQGDNEPPASVVEEKTIASAMEELRPLSDAWRQLVTFCATYYQRSLGEVALAALPPQSLIATTRSWVTMLSRVACSEATPVRYGMS